MRDICTRKALKAFTYDATKLRLHYDLRERRYGFFHPAPPEQVDLGYTDVFMGWRKEEAIAECSEANKTRKAFCNTKRDTVKDTV